MRICQACDAVATGLTKCVRCGAEIPPLSWEKPAVPPVSAWNLGGNDDSFDATGGHWSWCDERFIPTGSVVLSAEQVKKLRKWRDEVVEVRAMFTNGGTVARLYDAEIAVYDRILALLDGDRS